MHVPESYLHQRVGALGYRVLGLDIDGVCADYTSAFREFCSARMNLPESSFPEPTAYNLVAAGWPFSSVDEYLKYHREAVEDGLYARVPAYAGVSEALWSLSSADVHVRIVSHRLFLSGLHRVIVRDTADWLERQDIPYMSLCMTGLKDSIEATVYVEDSPSMIRALRKAGSDVVIFDQPYNRDLAGARFSDWRQGGELLLSRLGSELG
ncbi:hypothetical protein [Cellulomonas sp. ES6]|uniref:5' nucleotidase, NT5C type n=1 Tax=Cellulomonas sp. ES6 TaxID=3039384 RepID=UPI00198CB8B4|nr:hypothetical protein [Cellulomonas sp. ES6]MBD3778731.1 hypothetical protein [Micrococcales bacterium]WHP17702.1 hypothetical protein P9841_00535 [Cellulomonas sp. ES6]